MYNPFYTLVAQKLANFKHSFQVTLKFCLWDFAKEIESASIRRLTHLGKFFAFLISDGIVPLVALKKFDFLNSSPKETIFLQYLIAKIAVDSSDSQLSAIFRQFRLVTRNDASADDTDSITKERDVIQSGLRMFIIFQLENVSLPFLKDEKAFQNRLNVIKGYLE